MTHNHRHLCPYTGVEEIAYRPGDDKIPTDTISTKTKNIYIFNEI